MWPARQPRRVTIESAFFGWRLTGHVARRPQESGAWVSDFLPYTAEIAEEPAQAEPAAASAEARGPELVMFEQRGCEWCEVWMEEISQEMRVSS